MDTEERAARRAIRRAAPTDERCPHILRTGIGRDAVVRALHAAIDARGRGTDGTPTVILFGVGGALCDVADGPCVTTVVSEGGACWRAPLHAPLHAGETPATVVGVDRLVPTPADKRALHAVTGAHVVDMESHAFAEAASGLGVRWGVVRGVSDGVDHLLPACTLNWISPDGRSRPGRFVRDMALAPWLIPSVARTMPQVFRGLRAGAQRLAELVTMLDRTEGRA